MAERRGGARRKRGGYSQDFRRNRRSCSLNRRSCERGRFRAPSVDRFSRSVARFVSIKDSAGGFGPADNGCRHNRGQRKREEAPRDSGIIQLSQPDDGG